MTHLAILLNEIGVQFDAKKNYVRCFAHIINLCSQATIHVMEKDDGNDAYSDTDPNSDTENGTDDDAEVINLQPTRATRKAGPMRRARKTVAFIRKSGQRRDQFLDIIKQGNTNSLWKQVFVVNNTAVKNPVVLATVTVFPDVKTRWDSVFYMLRRLRYLQQVSPHIKHNNR
jgi:hypothetical protein